jgi:hypothetical protein
MPVKFTQMADITVGIVLGFAFLCHYYKEIGSLWNVATTPSAHLARLVLCREDKRGTGIDQNDGATQ